MLISSILSLSASLVLSVDTIALAKNPALLRSVLLYHVVKGEVTAADVSKLSSAQTLDGKPIQISVMGGTVSIDKAHVVKADVMASNGVIHVIDSVLIPPTTAAARNTLTTPTGPSQQPIAARSFTSPPPSAPSANLQRPGVGA